MERVLVVPKFFRTPESALKAVMTDSYAMDMLDMAGVFSAAGYKIRPSGEFTGRIGEIGIWADPSLNDAWERTVVCAGAAGLATPQQRPLREALEGGQVIVAKNPFSRRGESVYLLETNQQRQRFKTWLSLNIKREIMLAAQTGNTSRHPRSYATKWLALEYIETPSDYYTSFRAVADAHGQVHAVSLLRSGKRKGEAPKISFSGNDQQLALEQPNSPFFLNSKKIVSNHAQGGEDILLNGQQVLGSINRAVLETHGIDPDNPRPSAGIVEEAGLVGVACRGFFPYVGVDIIMEKGNHLRYLLEANPWPMLSPSEVGIELAGLNEDDPQRSCSREMYRKVAYYSGGQGAG